MKADWFKAPVVAPGQLNRVHRFVDGVAFVKGFTVAIRRMQYVVFSEMLTRIEGCPGQELSGLRRNRPIGVNNVF